MSGIPAWFHVEMPEIGRVTCEPGDPAPPTGPFERRSSADLVTDVAGDRFYLVAHRLRAAFDPGPPATIRYAFEEREPGEGAMVVLLGVLPLVLPAFGLTPLHGAAVTLDGAGACLVMGDSGAGKSTVLEGLLDAGATFLADDACAIDRDGILWPGPPLYSRWDADPPRGLPPFGDKRVARPPASSSIPLPVSRVVVLHPGSTTGVDDVVGGDAVHEVMSHHRSKWLLASGRARQRFDVTTQIASLPVTRLRYRRDLDTPEDVVGAVLDLPGMHP